MKNKYTIWRSSIFDAEDKAWKDDYAFYRASEVYENVDLKTDWRFCGVNGKRKELVLLGTAMLSDEDFPIKYPLIIDNGFELKNIPDEV